MNGFTLYIITAFSLIFVIEGLIYTLFPDAIRRMMALALTLPAQKLRAFGVLMTAIGIGLIWVMRIILQK